MVLLTQIPYVTDEEVLRLAPLPKVIELVAEGFRAEAAGTVRNFPVVRELIPEHDGIFGVKSGYLPVTGVLGLKAGGYWLKNPSRHGLGGHQSTVLLFNPETGQLKGVVAANQITGLRTGAAGAVAARALARPDSTRVAMLGTGVQGEMQLRGLAAVFSLTEVKIWSVDADSVQSFLKRTADLPMRIVPVTDPAEAVRTADIVVTTTPAFAPVFKAEWLRPGLHINAIGADTKGKQELETAVLPAATQVVVDSFAQASELGELQHPYRAGLMNAEQVVTLGQVLTGQATGRKSPADITIFDATGLIMQDLVLADYIWKTAEA